MKSNLLYILMLLVSMAMLSSCIMENGACPPDGKVVISFSFSTQENMTRGGHTWGDNLDDDNTNDYESSVGEDYDTRIKVKSLRAFIYDNQNNYICEIINKTYFELNDVNGSNAIEPNRYKFLGELELTPVIYSSLKDKECKIMLVANSALGENPNDFGSTQFSIDDITFPNGFIPMWGVTTQTLTLAPQQDLGIIYLLRSAAKVEVKLSTELVNNNYTIKEVFVNKHAATGYWFPNGWNNVNNTTLLAHSDCYNFTESLLSNISRYFTNNSNLSGSVIYLPEMNTEGADISIVISDGTSDFRFDNAIKFANYADGSATSTTFNVVRNHHYQYTITKVNTGVDLELTCSVQPWTLVKEEWDYTDVPAVYNDGYIKWINGTVNDNRVSFTPSSPNATFTFGLSAPENATWRAEFVTIKGNQNAFKFVEVEGGHNNTSYATGEVGDRVTLTVGTTGTASIENNEAYLRILVILPDGRTIRVSEILYSSTEQKEYIMVQTP